MATRWLLLLLVVSTQSVVSQSTTGSETRGVAEHQGDIETLVEQHKMMPKHQQQFSHILQPHQPGRLFATTFSHNFKIYLFQLQALTNGKQEEYVINAHRLD